ncbi:MAG TPA: glycosyltransferase, partial [Microbacteriaceae bacterium]|nr:glycosyltransferase [Microbacteriaceae bacterium]
TLINPTGNRTDRSKLSGINTSGISAEEIEQTGNEAAGTITTGFKPAESKPTKHNDSANSLEWQSSLTETQKRHLESACNVYALLFPGEEITFEVSIGDVTQMPAIAYDQSLKSAAPGTKKLGRLSFKSLAIGTKYRSEQDYLAQAQGSPARSKDSLTQTKDSPTTAQDSPEKVYVVRLPHADATPATTKPPANPSLARNVYREIERRSPLLLDLARETIMRRREREIYAPMPRTSNRVTTPEASALKEPKKGDKPAILFGLHWLQTGGAEQWAFETITLAKKLGFTPVIVTDQPSVHPLINSAVFDHCVLLILSYESPDRATDLELARAITENFALAGVVLHHSYWLYHALPWFKGVNPSLPVVDSLHIIEYLKGGYAGLAVQFDDHIDTHHVISPQLVEWLSAEQGVSVDRLMLAPLTKLTASDEATFKPRQPKNPFTISFIGRLSRQKRPDVFLMLVARLKKFGVPVRAIMHGDGEMRQIVDELITKYDLTENVLRRDETHAVKDTLEDSDLLVISSINEGITLTTFEANAAGVPVLSANVGSQSSIVEGGVLLDRAARPFIKEAVTQIKKMMSSETYRESVWHDQKEAVARLNQHDDAGTRFERLFKSWLV